MKLLAVLVSGLAFLTVTDAYFDCIREGMACKSGYCDYDTGACTCPDDMKGKDCGLNTTLESDGCTVPCTNNGTCVEEGDSAKCYCLEDYHGDTCDRPRTEIDCNGENMTITVTPYDGFKGNVYIQDMEDNTNCTFENVTEGGSTAFIATLNLEEGCGANVDEDSPDKGDKTYSRRVVIRYNPDLISKLDQLIDATCQHSAANVSSLDAAMFEADVRDKTDQKAEKAGTTYKPVKIEVQDEDGKKIIDDVYIGKPLRLFISLTDTAKFKKIKVERCTAVNGRQPPNRKVHGFVKNSCKTKESAQVINGPLISEDDQTTVIINFDAFKFTDSNKVEFECEVRHCKEGDNRCEPGSCRGKPSAGLGRRRRRDADGDQEGDDVLIKDSITVLDPSTSQIITDKLLHPMDCIQRTEIITSIIILATAIIVLFIVCFFLALKVIRSRSKMVKSETSSMASSDGSRLQIPRVKTVL